MDLYAEGEGDIGDEVEIEDGDVTCELVGSRGCREVGMEGVGEGELRWF